MKGGVAGAVAAVLPAACDDRPLPGNPTDAAMVATGGSGGSDAGSGGSAGSAGHDAGGGTDAPASCLGSVAAGNAAAVAVGALRIVGSNLVLGRDAGGLYAMSAICTHQGCQVVVVGAAPQASLACPCHGSAFSANGAVTRGPAGRPLQHFQVEVAADGSITICGGAVVASTTRTPT